MGKSGPKFKLSAPYLLPKGFWGQFWYGAMYGQWAYLFSKTRAPDPSPNFGGFFSQNLWIFNFDPGFSLPRHDFFSLSMSLGDPE